MSRYQIEYKPEAEEDLAKLPSRLQARIMDAMDEMENGPIGDVKKLKNFEPKYRCRVGDYRILFNIEGQSIVIYRILSRGDAYRNRR